MFASAFWHSSQVADPPYSFTGTPRFAWAIGYSILLAISFYAVGLPDQLRSRRQCAWAAALAVSASVIGVSVAQIALGSALLPRFVVFGSALVLIPWQMLVAQLSQDGRSRDQDRDRILLVVEPAEHVRLLDDLRMEQDRVACVVGAMSPAEAAGRHPGDAPLLEEQRRSAATLLVLDRYAQAEDRVIAQAAALHESGVRVRTLQGFYEEWLGKLPLSELERASLFFDIGELHRRRYGRRKRVMDLAIAAVGLVSLLVVLPLVAIGNRLGNRGPLLYRQTRIGRGGDAFSILKFRTMRDDAAAPTAADCDAVGDLTGPSWTSHDDPRVTPFGRLLRRSHVDELPQVLNVLRGDLSIVGPRPEQPHYVAELSDKLAFYDLRHLVRPGMTGWAQVKYGYAGDERDALEKLQYEFFYLRHQDMAFDLRIVVRTLRSVLGGQGAGR